MPNLVPVDLLYVVPSKEADLRNLFYFVQTRHLRSYVRKSDLRN